MLDTPRKLLMATVLTLLIAAPATAGTISLAWDPVTDSDLAGYRVYSGSATRTYTQSVDLGIVTSTTLTVPDCQVRYVAVKAYDAAGNESTSYSNEITGWARPIVTSVSPNAAEQGRTLAVTVTGSNFQPGAVLVFTNAGIVVNSITINSCTQLTATVTVGATAATGTTNAEVTNPDQVFGTGAGLFTVQPGVAPQVASTSPANGATGVSIAVQPTVTFSEAMLPSSITSATVRLLLASSGAAVAQAAGSPALSADGITATITPAANLTSGVAYKIQVIGGATGVFDLANRPMAATYVHSTGFSTVADTTAPTISAVASQNVGGTSATIVWTTNEDSDSQVFYRRTGDTADQSTPVDAAMVTSHTVTLTGLQPSTSYTYFVRSADSAGNAATSSPSQIFTTTASSFRYLSFETEGGALVSPVRIQTAAGAFNGSYLDTPTGTSTGTATTPAGTATFGVNVPTAGTWYLWVRMYGANATSDSWFESVDGAARQTITATQTGAWHWVAGRSYTLTAGLASVELGGRESQARVDRVMLTNDAAFVPSEQAVGDQAPPAAVTAFTATPSNQQVTLSWTNPSTSDFQRTVIRFRTDGISPTSPVDGFPVADRAAAPNSADTYVHSALTNGTTYSYAAFALDAAGNLAPASRITATPIDDQPPPNVSGARRTDARP